MPEPPLIVLAGAAEHDLDEALGVPRDRRLRSLERALAMEPQAIVDELLASNLRGRGGAFFQTGRKASFIPQDSPKPKYLVVNADESEPGTFKDREIMDRVPHRLLEGCLITAHAIGSQSIFIYIRGEYYEEFEVMRAALDEAREGGLASDDLLGGVTIVLHRGAGAYICGEETGLLESLEGKRGQPRSKPPFPAIQGLYAAPTLINNVETIANVPADHRNGRRRVREDRTPGSTRDTALLPLRQRRARRQLRAAARHECGRSSTTSAAASRTGASSRRSFPAAPPCRSSRRTRSTRPSTTMRCAADTFLGAAAIIVIDDRACMVQLGLRVAQFYMHESCGKCTPCREGTRWMVQLLRKIEDGHAQQSELDLLLDVCDRILGKCLCPLGDAAAMPVASYVNKFRDDFQAHVDHGGCPYGGESSLEGLFAPVDQHTHHPVVEVPA